MSLVTATGELQSDRRDVWSLVAEPYHLPDWWPAYTGVTPDHRGLAERARWEVVRSRTPGLLRRPEGAGLIVLTRVLEGWELSLARRPRRTSTRASGSTTRAPGEHGRRRTSPGRGSA